MLRKILYFSFGFLFFAVMLANYTPVYAVSCEFSASSSVLGNGSASDINITVTNNSVGDVIWMRVENLNSDVVDITGATLSGWDVELEGGLRTILTGGTLGNTQSGTIRISVLPKTIAEEFSAFEIIMTSQSDGTGTESCSGDVMVSVVDATPTPTPTTASSATSTPTPATTTVVITATPALTPTPTPKPVDRTPPSVSIETDFSKAFKESPVITGKASDSGAVNVGVASIEYSMDNGKNWLPVDEIKGKGEFTFLPMGLEDGNYEIKVRAKDNTGNIGTSLVKTMVIDRLPPMVGGNLISVGPQPLLPNSDGIIYALAGLPQKITLSAVGGPIEISILASRVIASPDINRDEAISKDKIAASSATPRNDKVETFSLTKNSDNGLWSGMLNFTEPGVYQLTAKSVDGAKNQTERVLNTVLVMENGQIKNDKTPIKDATISVFYLDTTTQRFVLWDGRPYGEANPQKTDETGAYKLLLPAGKYYLQVQASGYKTLKTNIFTIDKTMPINVDLNMEVGQQIKLGSWVINLPSFDYSEVPINLNIPTIPDSAKIINNLQSKEMPDFNLEMDGKTLTNSFLKGKPTIVTFLNTWSPFISDQISILDDLSSKSELTVAVIMPQESVSSISIYKKRGGYSMPIIADPDGTLVLPLNLQSIPTHVFLNRKGMIQKIMVGVLTKEELLNNLVN